MSAGLRHEGDEGMSCLICKSKNSRIVWRQGGFQIARCAGCEVLFAVNPPAQPNLNDLYDKGVLTGAPIDFTGRGIGTPPEWKQREQMSILDRLKRLGVSGGTLLDVGAFSGMFMQNAKGYGFQVAGVEPIREAYLHLSDTLGLAVWDGDLYFSS